MNFNGFNSSALTFLKQDVQGNGFSLDDIGSITLVETATPAQPTVTNSAKYFTDAAGLLSSIDDAGVVRTYVATGPSGNDDRIIAVNASCQVLCDVTGIVEVTGDMSMNGGQLQAVTIISADGVNPLEMTNGTTSVAVEEHQLTFIVDGQPQAQFSPTASLIVSPDAMSAIFLDNSEYKVANSSGFVMIADATSTSVIQGSTILNLSNSIVESNSPVQVPGTTSSATPDFRFANSTNTGLFSSAAGHLNVTCAGTHVADFDSTGANIKSVTINSNYALPTAVPTAGQTIIAVAGTPTWTNLFNGFQARYNGPGIVLVPTGSSQNICDVLFLGTGYSTGTFTYTAPITGIYELNYNVLWGWTNTVLAASKRLDVAFVVADGGTTFPGYVINQEYVTLAGAQPFADFNCMTMCHTLNAGATVKITCANNSSANNVTINTAYFSVKLLQST